MSGVFGRAEALSVRNSVTCAPQAWGIRAALAAAGSATAPGSLMATSQNTANGAHRMAGRLVPLSRGCLGLNILCVGAAGGARTYKSRGYAQIRIRRASAGPYHRKVCLSPTQARSGGFRMRAPEIIGRPD